MEEYLRSIGFEKHDRLTISKVFGETIVFFYTESEYIFLSEGGDCVEVKNCRSIQDFKQLIFIVTGFKL